MKYELSISLLVAVITLLSAFSCANMGNPNGGPYDEDPPKFVSSKPAPNQLNFKGKIIEIEFDEFVTVSSPSENVIVTPPQQQNPIVMGLGKKVRVELKDTMKENTTYTIDFTSSIADNNEKNVLENFSFAFSTGDVLDTLQISGRALHARDLEPVQKMIVGIHSDPSDTAFTKTPFLRTSKTDERGNFVIHNVAPGTYHVFALEDKNRNYAYDKNGDEGLAFLDTAVNPYAMREMLPDTIWKDTITVDTVRMVEKTVFYPKELLLWFFTDSVAPRQRLLKPDRPQEYILALKFNAPMDTFPVLHPVNFEPADSFWYVPQRAADADGFAVNYWVLDSAIYRMDTLKTAVSYWKNNDTVPDLFELKTDTIALVNKAAADARRKQQKQKQPPKARPVKEGTPADSAANTEEKEPVIPLEISVTPSGSLNPEDVITIKFNEPVLDVKKEYFRLELGRDTLWEEAGFDFAVDSLVAMTYRLKRTFGYGQRYRLLIDSAAFCSVYGHCSENAEINFTVKSDKDYGHLLVNVRGLPAAAPLPDGEKTETAPVPAFMELLNASGATARQATVINGVATFMNISPDKYYWRIILDENGNGKWDAGDYAEKRQPERVIYYMKQYEIRQNWKMEETWDVSTARIGEKPEELLKNKPKEKTNKKRDYRQDSQPGRGGSSRGANIRGLPF